MPSGNLDSRPSEVHSASEKRPARRARARARTLGKRPSEGESAILQRTEHRATHARLGNLFNEYRRSVREDFEFNVNCDSGS